MLLSLSPRHEIRGSVLTAVTAFTLLSACGGGSAVFQTITTSPPETSLPETGPEEETSAPAPDPFTFAVDNEQRDTAIDLIAVWAQDGESDFSSTAVVPITGSATYDGFLYGDISDDGNAPTDSLIGALELDVSFGSDTSFSGAVTDFQNADNVALSGSLTIVGGDFDRDGNPASDATIQGVAVSGILTDPDGTTYDLGVALEGDFLGSTAEAIGGAAIGGVSVDGVDQDFDGGFIAER